MTRPRATVVVVTWQGAHLLPDCLDALLREVRASEAQVVVVDNASTDGTAELLATRYPAVRRIVSDRNRGFAGGNNLALAEVDTDVAVLLNNDAVVQPGWLDGLLDGLDRDPRVAAVGSKVLLQQRFWSGQVAAASGVVTVDGDPVEVPHDALRAGRLLVPRTGAVRVDGVAVEVDGPHDVVNSVGGEVLQNGYGRDRGWLEIDAGQYDEPAGVLTTSGASVAFRMRALREVGLFDERFFLYYEDTDLCWRLRLAGWEVRTAPASVVRHAHSATSGAQSDLHRFYSERNRLLTLARNAPAGLAAAAAARFPASTASIATRGSDPDRARVHARAFASYLRLLPGTRPTVPAARRRSVAREWLRPVE